MHLLVVSCTPRAVAASNTDKILTAFCAGFEAQGNTTERHYLARRDTWPQIRAAFEQNDDILFALPLFVECVPGIMIYTVTLNPALDKTVRVLQFAIDQVNRAKALQLDPGGKGINVSKVLHQLGQPNLAMGFLGGETGDSIARRLTALGIQHDFVRISGETRTNLKLFDLSNQKITEINEHGCPVDAKDLASFVQKFNQLLPTCEIVVLSGSTPPGIPDNFYYECIEDAKKAGKKVILDADGEAFRLGLKAIPYAVKPNLHARDHNLKRVHFLLQAVILLHQRRIFLIAQFAVAQRLLQVVNGAKFFIRLFQPLYFFGRDGPFDLFHGAPFLFATGAALLAPGFAGYLKAMAPKAAHRFSC